MRLTISETVQKLKQGSVIALPTETVYGLAASLAFPQAIQRIFELKNRPQDNPLIIHLAHLEQLEQFKPVLPPGFDSLVQKFWPGPLTFVLTIDPKTIPEVVRAGLPTAAFRIPSSQAAREVIEQVGPIVMPSANISGRPSATRPEHVEEDFGENFPVLDGGFCQKGLESTIIIYKDGSWQIIRQGAIPREHIAEILDVTIYSKPALDQPICPGQKYRHYAPRTHLRPVREIDSSCEGVIVGYSDRIYSENAKIYLLGSSQDPAEIARNLYAVFRLLDTDHISDAFIDIALPKEGVFLTILERIRKACT